MKKFTFYPFLLYLVGWGDFKRVFVCCWRGTADSDMVGSGNAHDAIHPTRSWIRQTCSRYITFFFQKYKLHFQFNACEFVLLGFPDLSQDDQLILIKIGFFEVWLTHVSRLVNAQEMTLTLADGATLSKKQMELIFDVHSIILSLYYVKNFSVIKKEKPCFSFLSFIF